MKLLIEALQAYERWLERRRRAAGRQTEEQAQAVRSVLRAVSETRSYLYDLRHGAAEDRPRESLLSRLWADAAIDVRAVDRRLSRIAVVASQRWADPELLNAPGFEDIPEQLDLIQRQCEWLLERW